MLMVTTLGKCHFQQQIGQAAQLVQGSCGSGLRDKFGPERLGLGLPFGMALSIFLGSLLSPQAGANVFPAYLAVDPPAPGVIPPVPAYFPCHEYVTLCVLRRLLQTHKALYRPFNKPQLKKAQKSANSS
jgi:hypothetical protein